jgi:hypothetical protein
MSIAAFFEGVLTGPAALQRNPNVAAAVFSLSRPLVDLGVRRSEWQQRALVAHSSACGECLIHLVTCAKFVIFQRRKSLSRQL